MRVAVFRPRTIVRKNHSRFIFQNRISSSARTPLRSADRLAGFSRTIPKSTTQKRFDRSQRSIQTARVLNFSIETLRVTDDWMSLRHACCSRANISNAFSVAIDRARIGSSDSPISHAAITRAAVPEWRTSHERWTEQGADSRLARPRQKPHARPQQNAGI